MPFQNVWDPDTGQKAPNRNYTGPPKAPDPGTTQTSSGVIVGSSADVSIPPATPVEVNPFGPREPVLSKDGSMNPRVYRFLMELWRRTGGYQDNINRGDRDIAGSSTTGSLSLTGYAPTVTVFISPTAGSLGITGNAPTIA